MSSLFVLKGFTSFRTEASFLTTASKAVVGGTAMAVPLFGPILIFKITHFEFSFPLFYYFLSFYFLLLSNSNKIVKLLHSTIWNRDIESNFDILHALSSLWNKITISSLAAWFLNKSGSLIFKHVSLYRSRNCFVLFWVQLTKFNYRRQITSTHA